MAVAFSRLRLASEGILMMRRRRRRLLLVSLPILFLLLVLFVWAAWPGRSNFTVSPETTYVTGPLDEHGYVDYVTAVNERLSKGIRPENNANTLIWKALGPHPEGGTMPSRYFAWLGIDSPPENGTYFVTFEDYLKETQKTLDPPRRLEITLHSSVATEWPWAANDQPELANWLKRNEAPLAVLIDASRRPDYFNPLVPKTSTNHSPRLIGALLPNVQVCRATAMALVCRAMLRVHDGRADEAWRDLIACHRLGRLLSRGGTLIEMLVGLAVDQIASKADRAFLDKAKLTSAQIQACLHELLNLPPMSRVADHLSLAERFMFLDSAMFLSGQGSEDRQDGSSSYSVPAKDAPFVDRLFTRSVDWDNALRNANTFYNRYATATQFSDRKARQREMDQIESEIQMPMKESEDLGLIGRYLMSPTRRGEFMGNRLLGLLLPAFDKIQTAAERNEQTQRNLRLAFALAAFHADIKRYPAKLDELAPKYMDKIPSDLFSDKPLIYKPNSDSYLLYSVGPNGKDDEGRTTEDEPRGDDIAVRMPVPAPREKK
jgi:hypothetical protein